MYEDRIARGAALLDEQRPGWRDEIDVETLDLASECDCILGQLHGDYLEGVDMLDLNLPDRVACGFDILSGVRDEDKAYARLTAEWRQALAQTAGGGDG